MTAIAVQPTAPEVDHRPPGERYYRHPGDIVRLVLWAGATVVLLLFIDVATNSSDGLRVDLGGAATSVPEALRRLLLAGAQIGVVAAPIALAATLAAQRRWRRLGTVIGAGLLAAALVALLGSLLDDPPAITGSLDGESWLISARFPSPGVLAAALALVAVGKPWLPRRWRRAGDLSIATLFATMAIAGSGIPELLLALSAGGLTAAAVLVALGAPNRRPTPAAIRSALATAGITVDQLDLRRAAGGRSQLYRAGAGDGGVFLKVYAQDSRDADLLYRSCRTAVLREPGQGLPSPSLAADVEHQALMLLLADRAGVATPAVRGVVALPDDSMVLAMDDVPGRRLDELTPDEIGAGLLAETWRQVARLHGAGLAHGALRAANILAGDDGRPVLIDLGAGVAAASRRAQVIDRAELLASLASLVGVERAVASVGPAIDTPDFAASIPYLQPLALSAATRRATGKALLAALRARIAEITGASGMDLERLIRVRPRTIVMIAALAGAFYVLLPQLADVDDSIGALRSANWGWLAGCLVMSSLTYVTAAVAMRGGVDEHLPLTTTVQVSLASSFVNRVTPANVGGMALGVRYMQKAGVPPAEAVTGVGLNVVAGGIVHVGLLAVFFAWAGQSDDAAFSLPGSSKLLVVVAVLLAFAGAALATRWGRMIVRAHLVPAVRQSWASITSLVRSPGRLFALFGGSIGVTLAYATALACAVAAFDGGIAYAQVGAVYLGASLIAAAAPTPGGLGAMEAALIAGLTGVGVEPSTAVAAVLSYRLITFWLPILPGWMLFHSLDRRDYI
jgi:uncharacterized membrane protein YbhN (UPF0104 family)